MYAALKNTFNIVSFFLMLVLSSPAIAVDGYKDLKFGMSQEQVLESGFCTFGSDVDMESGVESIMCTDFKYDGEIASAIALFIDGVFLRLLIGGPVAKKVQEIDDGLREKYGEPSSQKWNRKAIDAVIELPNQRAFIAFDQDTILIELNSDENKNFRAILIYTSPEFDNLKQKKQAFIEVPSQSSSSFMEEIVSSFNDPIFMEQLVKTIWLLFVIGFVMTLIAGMTNKVVIYFDFKDFFVSLMTIGIWGVGAIVVNIYGTEGQEGMNTIQKIVLYSSGGISASCFILTLKSSVLHNRSIGIGFLIGVFKIISAVFGVVMIFGIFDYADNKKRSIQETIFSIVILGIFVWVGKKLINGEQVYIKKGWELPETQIEPEAA